MKKITVLLAACSLALVSFAAGGNITYELNGGVTNDYGWKNKADMLVGLNLDYNTFYNITTGTWVTWETLDVILKAADPVTRIPTFATPNMWGVLKTPKWLWLHDYIVATGQAQGIAAIAEAENAFWRYEVSAFFTSRKRTGYPISADYTVAGQPEAFMPTWKRAFAGPATYDGTTEIIIPNPYKEGFTFDGWYDNAQFTGSKVTSIPVGAEGDKALFAKWIEYIPTCAEIKGLAVNATTKAGGVVTYVNGTTAFIQDATAGLKVEFATAPALSVGERITISGTVSSQGTYKKVSNASLSSKEAASLPAHQSLALATLKADAASYMFEYISLEGLKISAYGTGSVTLIDEASNSITLMATLNQASLPVNTKVNVKGVVSFETEVVVVATPANVTASPVPRPDPATYEPIAEGKYTLTSKWLVSNTLDNLSANPIGTSNFVRGMAAKNGKMYFVDRELRRLTVVDGATGNRLPHITLAANIFKYTNAEQQLVDAGTLPFNDIKIDHAGNVLLGNGITSNAQPFQVWKIDLATGAGTLVVNEILKNNPDYADNVSLRFDAFGVFGDVNTNAIIMAANASAMEAFKWTITNGVAGPAELITIATDVDGNFLYKLSNPGTAPQIFPVDENYFYLDGWDTLPTLIDMQGYVIDGFYNVPKEVEDWSIGLSNRKGHNGLVEFEMAGEHFFLIASMNTAGTPPSSFRLFKWANAGKEFKDIQSLWTLPAAGMGSLSNSYRTAVPSVEVNEVSKVATLYLYTGENGYGVYEFKINAGT
ncbi:MAG: InlB B-repeat-containing protein, partial [Paludibacter sp.]|nr:InlB B-repeat-containing protein [Paludibacter sp.]